MLKTMLAAACVAVCCCGEPAKADYLYYTGQSPYGGNEYNHGQYYQDPIRSNAAGEVIRDQSGNSYQCNGIGQCYQQDY